MYRLDMYQDRDRVGYASCSGIGPGGLDFGALLSSSGAWSTGNERVTKRFNSIGGYNTASFRLETLT